MDPAKSIGKTEQERTFQYDEDLPSLPVPKLEDTLRKYLDSVKPVTTDEEYCETERVVTEFGNGIGKKLHAKLLERAKTQKNWLEQWWFEAYLVSRAPLGIASMAGANKCIESFWPPSPGSDVERGALFLWHLMRFHQDLRREVISVEKSKSGEVKFSMHQIRYLLNGSREPGEKMDKLINCFKTEREGPCPTHVIVSCNGHLFRIDPYDSRGTCMNAKEMAKQLQYIKDHSKQRGQCIALLTADERTNYAKTQSYLKNLDPMNADHIRTIDTSVCMLALDDANPLNVTQVFQESISGRNAHNHWYDKSYIPIIFANGTLGCICDHAAYDGMACVNMTYFGHQVLEADGGSWPDPHCKVRADLPEPTELVFVMDSYIEDAIVKSADQHYRLVENVEILVSCFANYGKNWCKRFRLHPDFVCQLAIQLAYYKMYGRPAPTYETATTRQYYHGRTETVRSCTSESLAWCKAMVDPAKSQSERAELLKAAYLKHATMMGECIENRGCDRHLMGLYLISQEMGMPPPAIFTDPGYVKSGGGGNYILSTSLAGYRPLIGLVPAMCQDGYFATYRIENDRFELAWVNYRNSAVTDNYAMFRHMTLALIDIQNLMLHAAAKL